MRIGVPYQGSKNAIARELISVLPKGNGIFVDLFAGGCAMTHAAMLSGKYSKFVANDLHGFGIRLFVDAALGKCHGKWREWVSREEFLEKKDTDPLIHLCWSFSNGGRTYLFGKDKEEAKRKYHFAVLDGTANDLPWLEMENHERLKALENLESLKPIVDGGRLETLNMDYREVPIADGDVVYCDIPYKGRQKYNTEEKFNHDEFWAWADSRPFPVFVSEYTAPEGFTPIWAKGKLVLMNQFGSFGKIQERLFVQDRYAPQFQTDLFGFE